MPSQTFLNLSSDKQNKIIDSAIKEFSNVAFSDVSINRIIKDAGISRGSFYMYFDDKYDLLMYLLEMDRINLLKSMKPLMGKDIINIEDVILLIHSHFYKKVENEKLRKFYQNVIVFFQGRPVEETRRIQHKIPMVGGFKNIYKVLDKNQFKFNDEESIVITIDIAMGIFKQVMFHSIIRELSYEESKKLLLEYLVILKTGYGKEK